MIWRGRSGRRWPLLLENGAALTGYWRLWILLRTTAVLHRRLERRRAVLTNADEVVFTSLTFRVGYLSLRLDKNAAVQGCGVMQLIHEGTNLSAVIERRLPCEVRGKQLTLLLLESRFGDKSLKS